jgi:integrase
MKSTGCDRRSDADDFVRSFIDARTSRSGNATFKEYQQPFFVPETCPHVQRLRDGRKNIGLTHIHKCRGWLNAWVVTDAVFCSKPMNRITRGDLLDLRKRIRARVKAESKRIYGEGLNTVNKAMSAVGTIFYEAHFRGDIPTDPGQGLGIIEYDRAGPDILTLPELRKLGDPEHWTMDGRNGEKVPDVMGWKVFRFTALTGMRCSEVLGLHGSQLDGNILHVDFAFKGKESGRPKWGKTRDIVLAEPARELISDAGLGLVFCYPGGRRLGETWWREHFDSGLDGAGIIRGRRNLTPHSLRHSLNTHLLEVGVDPLRIQLYLWGPKVESQGITKTQNVYTHFGAAMTEPVARAIERLYCDKKSNAAKQA